MGVINISTMLEEEENNRYLSLTGNSKSVLSSKMLKEFPLQ